MTTQTEALARKIATGASSWKNAVRCVATSNITLSGLQTVDDIVAVEGDRVLVAGQTNAKQNGIYDASTGTWTRSSDLGVSTYIKLGMAVRVVEGTAYAGSTWSLTSPTTGTPKFGVDNLTFTRDTATVSTVTGDFSLSGDANLTLSAGSNDNQTLGATVSTLRIDAASGATLTGITGGADGRILLIANVDAADGFTIAHDATSTAGNRFYLPGGVDLVIPIRGGAAFRYDATTSRWHCLAVARLATATKTASTIAMWDAARDLSADVLHLESAIDSTGALSIAPVTNGAGAGFATTLGGGLGTGAASGLTTVGTDGATPGTNAGGGVDVQIGTKLSGTLYAGAATFKSGTDHVFKVGYFDTLRTIRFGAGDVASSLAGAASGRIEGLSVSLVSNGGTSISVNGNGIDVSTATYFDITGQYTGSPNSQAFAASTTVNLHLGNYHRIGAMTADMTSLTLSNPIAGSRHQIEFLQDGTGGRAVTPHANFRASVAHALTVDTTANYRTIWTVDIWSATEWFLTNREVHTT